MFGIHSACLQKFIELASSVKCNVATAANIMLIAGLEKERSLAVRHCELDAALWELLGNHLRQQGQHSTLEEGRGAPRSSIT